MIRLISEARGEKPETLVIGETEGHFERKKGTPVHYREDDSNPICRACGQAANVWLGSEERWKDHAERCGR